MNKKETLQLENRHLFWIFALLAGIGFDQLFWERSFGINFFLFILLGILGGLIPIWLENTKIPWTAYLLLVPIGFFAIMTFIRAEPFTTLTNVLITLALLILFSITLQTSAWYKFTLRDHLVKGFQFSLNTIIGGILFFIKTRKKSAATAASEGETVEEQTNQPSKDRDKQGSKKSFIKQAAPYLRGTLLALPILALLAFLLGQADPIFNDRLQKIFSSFSFDNLGETLARFILVLVIAYGLLSVYAYALLESDKSQPDDRDTPAISPFLGSIEATMVLGGVNLLFLTFVILQFNYLFSGGENISITGYTYAEYARRGFFELITVAVISVFLFYVLSLVTKREQKTQQRLFSILGVTLVALVAIILVSAYIRLNLYEAAYGFTRLRTLAHIFMVWVGLLLVGIAVIELTKQMPRLALILICFILGFGLTINILNIDKFIAQKNVARAVTTAEQGQEPNLDTSYLNALSEDAIPTLVTFFKAQEIPESIKDEIGGVLACKLAGVAVSEERSWQSYHDAKNRAGSLLRGLSEDLKAYPVSYDMYTWFVEVNGEVKSCQGQYVEPFD